MSYTNSFVRIRALIVSVFASALLVLSVTPASAQLTWTGSAMANWNTTDANWNVGPTYSDGSTVVFPDGAANTTIAIDSAGVLPQAVMFTNSTTPYTFTGGAIGDYNTSTPTTVTLNGAGTVTFNNTNTYSGVTTVNRGTLVAGPSALGGSGNLVLVGGTFQPAALTPGLTANYYGPLIGGPLATSTFTSIVTSSLTAFNTTYLPQTPPNYTNNITATLGPKSNGNFDFDTTGEGTLFPAPWNTGDGGGYTNWAASYTGYFYAATSGVYTFGLNSDDNSRLWIDGDSNDTAVITNGTVTTGQGWAGYGVIQAQATVSLTAGFHEITIGYDEGTGGFGLEAFYAPPGSTLANNKFLPLFAPLYVEQHHVHQ